MSEQDVPTTLARFAGPRGTMNLDALLDTGASSAILLAPDAEKMGIRAQGEEPVHTNNGTVVWGKAKTAVTLDGGKSWTEVPVWIAPPEDEARTTLGWPSMQALGFKLSPPHYPTAYSEQEG